MKKGIALQLLLAVGFGMVLEHVWLQMLHAKPLYPLRTRMFYLLNGEPATVRVNVRDAQRRPVAGAEICVVDSSGATHVQTAADGAAIFKIHEEPIRGIIVNGRDILRSYWVQPVPSGIDVYYLEDSPPVAQLATATPGSH